MNEHLSDPIFLSDVLREIVEQRLVIESVGNLDISNMPINERFNTIRKQYKRFLPRLIKGERICPYFLNWQSIFTRIESDIWSAIRYAGIPFYPQVPVGKFFVDFGDPHKKIAIECDGKRWHNKERDSMRDMELSKLGWSVYRIPGKECIKPEVIIDELDDGQNSDIVNDWALNSGEGVVSAIAFAFYEKRFPDSVHWALNESLEKHLSL